MKIQSMNSMDSMGTKYMFHTTEQPYNHACELRAYLTNREQQHFNTFTNGAYISI